MILPLSSSPVRPHLEYCVHLRDLLCKKAHGAVGASPDYHRDDERDGAALMCRQAEKVGVVQQRLQWQDKG